MESLIKEIHSSVIEGKSDAVKEKTQVALNTGVAASVILNEGMIAAMGQVGRLFEEGESRRTMPLRLALTAFPPMLAAPSQ